MTEQNVLLEDTRPGAGSGGTAAEMQATKYLICLSDGLRYGLDAEQVVEIITDHTITPLPCVPGYVQGVINLRGQIIPVIDLRLRLGSLRCGQCRASHRGRILFLSSDGGRARWGRKCTGTVSWTMITGITGSWRK